MNSRIRALIREIRAKDPLCPAGVMLEAGVEPEIALRHRCVNSRSAQELSVQDILEALAQKQRELEAERRAVEMFRALAKR